jgi:hypothetical protein
MLIKLGCGIDNILFGMTEKEIVELIGLPDKVVIDGYNNRNLIYNRLRIILKIELENESRFGWLEIHNKQARWNNANPWELERKFFLELLSTSLNDSYSLDDYGEMESYSFKENWIELQYEFGELASFNFGVNYYLNNEPLWPIPHCH